MFGFDPTIAECPVCGALYRDPAKHQVWHDSLRELVRRVMFPDLTMEELEQAMQDPSFAAMRVVAEEEARIKIQQAAEEAMTPEERQAAEVLQRLFGLRRDQT